MKDDLISKQTAIKDLEKLIKDCNPEHFIGHQKFIEFMDDAEIGSFGNWQFANGFNIGLTAAEIAIEKLPSAQFKQQWISVSERLPNTGENVLVTDGIDMFVAWRHYLKGWKSCDSQFDRNTPIIAWMPLPDPYEE